MLNSTLTGEKNSKKIIRKKKRKLSPFHLAVIDLGTNSVRFDVYRLSRKGVLRTYRTKIMIRLGDGVYKTGKLSADGMARTLKAFLGFKRLLREMHVDRVVAFGTSALRSANNSKLFLNTIKEKSGIQVKVISGREEGELIARGIMANLEVPKAHYALVDIGGGSTEISLCYGRKVLSCHSYKLGANRLQQMFLQSIPPVMRRGELHPVLALRQHLKVELNNLEQECKRYPLQLVIGSSGTIRTVGKILKKLGRSGQPVHRADLSALVAEMQNMTREQLRKLPGLEPKRVDLILSGSILLEELMYALGVRQLAITELALRDGILQKELDEHGAIR